MIDKEHTLPITKQCKVLQLSRSSVYYVSAPVSGGGRDVVSYVAFLCFIGIRCVHFPSKCNELNNDRSL